MSLMILILILTLALRNISRHFSRHSIIILLISTITLILFIGNSLLMESDRSLKDSYSASFTGDIVIAGRGDSEMSLFGAYTPGLGEYFTIPLLENHDAILEMVKSYPAVRSAVSQVSGVAELDVRKFRRQVFLFGVSGPEYFEQFPGITVHSGNLLRTGEQGIMITKKRADEINSRLKMELQPGDPIMLTMFNQYGVKIREVPLRGIFSYNSPNELMADLVIVDAQTLRDLNGIILADGAETTSAESLGGEDIDALFGGELMIDGSSGSDALDPEALVKEMNADTAAAEGGFVNGGWHFIVIRLNQGAKPGPVIRQLRRDLESRGFNASVLDWRQAAGTSALLVILLRFFYNGGFLLIALAGVIAIINIFIISLFERTREIGTLRALGASRSFVFLMILTEILIISLLAGILAVFLGFVGIKALNTLAIPLKNSLLVMLLGKNHLTVAFSPRLACISILVSTVIGLVSSLYPVIRALKIQPVTAVSKG
jgi:ABC-type lipoprotein release transport system permease subunit